MDLDAYTAAHGEEWERLDRLARQRHLSGAEADELIDLYRSGATQLSAIKSTVGESVPGTRLSLALSRGRLKFTGTPANPLRQLTVFFTRQLPAAMYRVRWLTVAIGAFFAIVGTAYGIWVATTPEVLAALGSPAELEQIAEEDFVGYYSESSEAVFAGQVWTNNALIAAQNIAFGIIGVFVPYSVFSNAQGVGQMGGIMASQGHLDRFFLYIAPHGQLELYSLFLAGATGLLIFWAWVAPGPRTRGQALAQDGRAFFTLVVGVAITLLISGIVEGVVTRQDWPWPLKIGIGTVALASVLVYQWVLGRAAYRSGETGDLEEFERGAERIVSG